MRRQPSPRRSDTLEQILTGLLIGTVFSLAAAGVVVSVLMAVVRRLA